MQPGPGPMQRRLCSAILALQAVVLGLTTPVLLTSDDVSNATALVIGLGLLVACVLAAGMLRSPAGYWLGWAIQIAATALGFLITAMFALGLIFLLLWLAAVRLGATIDRDRAAAGPGPEAGH